MKKPKVPEVEILLQDVDENNITDILKKYEEITKIKKGLEEYIDYLKNLIKVYMKERGWKKHLDKESKISVSISTIKKEQLDKKELKYILSEAQLAQVTKITTYEKMQIVTEEMRKRLKKYVKQNKK
jgi:hypothetical protein